MILLFKTTFDLSSSLICFLFKIMMLKLIVVVNNIVIQLSLTTCQVTEDQLNTFNSYLNLTLNKNLNV